MKKSLSQIFIFLMFISNVYCQYETEWIKTIGGNFDDIPSEIIISSDGNLLLVGYTVSTDGIFENNHGKRDGILVKMNYDGEVIWNKTFGGNLTDSISGTGLDYCNSIVQLENLDLVIGGGTNSINGDITNSIYNGFDFWFLQTNELGENY